MSEEEVIMPMCQRCGANEQKDCTCRMVYLVTHGHYSDFHVAGVFSTRKNAERFRDYFGLDGIEEEQLDPLALVDRDLRVFSVLIKRDGEVRYANEDSDYTKPQERERLNARNELYITTTAKSKGHAISHAVDRRRVWLAEDRWPENREVKK